jgi:hypothetical protein
MSVSERSVAALLAAAIPTLVRAVDEEMGDDFSLPARLLMFEADPEGVTFGVKELEPGQHPLDELLGFAAPEEWSALGTICHGWATRTLDTRPSRAADRVRVRSVHVVARDGTEIGGFHPTDGQLTLQDMVLGTVPDALRRCLDLPTAPPETAPPPTYATWEEVRWEVITGRRRLEEVSPTLAAWMDVGMFARWTEGDIA